VDLTLVHADGSELAMPTPHDDFTEKAHRDYKDLPAEAIRDRALEKVMTAHGFIGLPTEWWHFDDANWEKYPLIR
jgi:D-alanyl-D-alanine dipeptidase